MDLIQINVINRVQSRLMSTNLTTSFKNYVEETSENIKNLNNISLHLSYNISLEIILDALKNGNKLILAGNGGSHSDACHIAGELVNYFSKPHKAIPVITLGTNATVSTAWANDHNYESQLARELEAIGKPGDVFLAITTSGKSANIKNSLQAAGRKGIKRIVLASAKAQSNLENEYEVLIAPKIELTHKIQEAHIVIYHSLCIDIENNLPVQYEL
jgi:D-sedoheptulose 7-phosphate isomerase